ncbi:MAG: hypothetical protein JW837_05310 [Sedimentisphaerales bacterium]|nr:hypothetical protein [Sedimentisphaerales bacterium]
MKTKRFWIYVITAALISLGVFVATGTIAEERRQLQQELRERLRGCEGVYIFVDVIAKDKSTQEQLKQQFQTDVDLALRDSDIEILTKEELETTPGRPRLSLYVVAFEDPAYKGAYLYCFRIAHIEDATLVRSYGYAEGICWDSGHYVGRDKKPAIRQAVKTQLNKYITDYLAVNPKEPAKPKQPVRPSI